MNRRSKRKPAGKPKPAAPSKARTKGPGREATQFRRGNPGGPGAPFGGLAAAFKGRLWKAGTPDRQDRLAELLWRNALKGKQFWVRELLDRLGIKPDTQDPEVNPLAGDRLRVTVELLDSRGLGGLIPPQVRAMALGQQLPTTSGPRMIEPGQQSGAG